MPRGGTVELKTERLFLRRHRSEDAAVLFEIFGTDPQMFEYSGWNPYQTKAMATEKSEMRMVYDEEGSLEINGQMYDKLIFEYNDPDRR